VGYLAEATGLPDVFVSYSRRDSGFVRRLTSALDERGKDAWVDVDGIRDAEAFPDALKRAVENSDAFVFVISPDSVRSEFCEQEVEHAASLNKRIVPLAHKSVTDTDVPEEVRFLNWIPATEDTELDATADRLVIALDTDLDWERQHSRLTVKTLEWEHANRDRSFLLRGSDLDAAERWLAIGADKDPGPTALETEYLVAARAAASRRQRNLVIASLGVAVVSIALLVFALISRGDAISAKSQAINARNTASAQALTSDAERVGAQALTEKNLDLAMLYAVAGVKLQDRLETRSDLLQELQDKPFAIRLIRPSQNQIPSLAVNSRGLLAAGDTAGIVRFEEMKNWRPSGRPIQLAGSIPQEAMAFSPNGATLAVVTVAGSPQGPIQAGPTGLYAIDVGTGKVRRLGSWRGEFNSVPYPGASLAYDRTGRHIALSISEAAPDGSFTKDTLRLLDAVTGRQVWERRYPMRSGQAEARVTFAPDGTLVTSAQQGDTLLWNARTGRIEQRFPIGGQPAISTDGSTLALAMNNAELSTANSRIAVIRLRTGRTRFFAQSLPNVWLRGFAFTPDGRTLVAETIHGDVYLFDVPSGTISAAIPAPPGARASEVLDPTGRTALVASQAGSVVAFDVSGLRRLGRAFHWNTPNRACGAGACMVVSRHGEQMATAQGDGSVALIDLRTLRPALTLPARDGDVVSALAFFPNSRTLVTGGSDGHLTMRATSTGAVTKRIAVGEPVWWVAVSPDGRLLAAQTQPQTSTSSHIEVRPASGGEALWTHSLQDGTGGLSFSPDGKEVAALGCCTSSSTVAAWDVKSGRELFRGRVAANHATTIAYEPGATALAIGTEDGHVLFWNAHTGVATRAPLLVSTGQVAEIAFSADGTLMAVASRDGSTTLWDVRSGRQVGSSFPSRPNVITVPVFEPDGRLLIEYLSDAAEWPLDLASWERFACRVAGRDLTRAEWRGILPNRPYERICA
jgi:WD40 repeat protein